MRAFVATLVSLSLAAAAERPAAADDPPLSPEAVSAQVKAAHAAADTAKVEMWAAKDAPDPWLVADALLVSGAREAAEVFAKAAPRKDVERLPEFVASWKSTDGDEAARGAIQTGNAALQAQKHAEALAAFDAAKGEATPVVAVRLGHGRAIALMRLERFAEAAAGYEEVAARAEKLGWLSRAAGALGDVVRAEFAAKHLPQAVAAAQRIVSLETARGSRTRTAEAHRLAGNLEASGGGNDAAIADFQKAIALFDDSADGAGAARTRNDLAEVLLKKRDYEHAEGEALRAVGKAELMGLWPEVVRGHMAVAHVHRAKQHLGHAISSYESALEAAEKAGDPALTAPVVLELGECFGNRGEAGDQAKALELHLRAQQIYEGLGNRLRAGTALANAADSNSRLGHDDAAKEQADRVVALARELGAAWLEGRGLQLLGELAERQKKPDQALAAYTAAAARFEAAGDRIEAARAVAGTADMQRLLGDLPKAREAADRAQKEGERLRDRGVIAYALLVGARIRKDQGLREEALGVARLAREAYASIRNARGVAECETLIQSLEAAPPR